MKSLCTAEKIAGPCLAEPFAAPRYRKLSMDCKPVFEKLAQQYPQRVAGYTFAELFSWNAVYSYEWSSAEDGTVFITCTPEGETGRHFLQPLGTFGADAQASFLHQIKMSPQPMKIFGVTPEFMEAHKDFVAKFTVENDPGLANYVYSTESLATLAGKAYAKKRNQIAQARALYEWTAEALTGANAADCLAILDSLDQTHNWGNEKPAMYAALENFAALELDGTLLRSEGKPVAFAVFDQLTPDTSVVLFEKALDDYKGLYQVINQETAKMIAAHGTPLINREEDMGLPGLRHAKQSYNPVEVVPAYTLLPK